MLTEWIIQDKYLTIILRQVNYDDEQKNRRQTCVQADVNKCKITNWKERSKTAQTIEEAKCSDGNVAPSNKILYTHTHTYIYIWTMNLH